MVGLVALFGLVYYFFFQNRGQQQGWGQRPGGAQNFGGPPQGAKKERWSGPIPNPPKEKITYYKGLWSGLSFGLLN